MKRLTAVLAVTVLIATLGAGIALAQSSGSFNYAYNQTACVDPSGALSGGIPPTVTALSTGLKVSSGNGNVIILRPSAVIGLLTDVSVGSKNNTSSAQAGVTFQVSVSGPGSPKVTPSQPITFADRYIQISTNLFQAISTQCSTLDPTNGCFFNFNETTLDAHSFDWVVENLSSGVYELTVSWTPTQTATTGGTALACVGPVMYTAEQAKIFAPSAGLSY